MMTEELILCPFERSVIGPQGAILLRRHERHARLCSDAIRRRNHPAWSSLRTDYRVTGDAA
jgi:hypothetical protein